MLVALANDARDYAWGSTTLIPQLQEREPSGAPEAEVWFGDHPGSPARVGDGTGRTLDTVRTDAGAPRLSFLLKLLAAATPLSIQVHPSIEQARAGFAREEAAGIARDDASRNYRDENHKPELIVAVSDTFRALAGLRPLEQTRAFVSHLPATPAVQALSDRLDADADDATVLRDVVSWALAGDPDVDGIVAALAEARGDDFAPEREALLAIAQHYPGDPGILVALLMNYVQLRRGEAVFVTAGALHAYLEGLGVELMAASDNVLRGGLTPKHIDVPELLSILDSTPSAPPLLEPSHVAEGIDEFSGGLEDFSLLRVRATAGATRRVPLVGPAIALSTTGGVAVTASSGTVGLGPGEAAYADEDEPWLEVSGDGEVFVAQPGRAR